MKDRVAKARNTLNFSKVHTTKNDTTFHVLIPGSKMKQYDVFGRWYKQNNLLSVECKLRCGASGYKNCPGATKTVCYHQFAAIIRLAHDAKKKVAFCKTQIDAINYANMKNGKKFKVQSRQSGSIFWFVVYKD